MPETEALPAHGDGILCVNAGSSSIKIALFRHGDDDLPELMARGRIEANPRGKRLVAEMSDGSLSIDETLQSDKPDAESGDEIYAQLLRWADAITTGRLAMVGHRVVHGGPHFDGPVLVDRETKEAIEKLTPLAPLHQPSNLAPIDAIARLRPALRQAACFDTAFHRSIDPIVASYALPRALMEKHHLRKYGFHGLSFESIALELERRDPGSAHKRTVIAHLGSGASLCALKDGGSVDTTMGFSVLDGVVMATRCGSVDPGVLLYLLKNEMSLQALEDALYRRSGLAGLADGTSSVSDLLHERSPASAEALEIFAASVARQCAAMAATLGGIERFVFTGGVGENEPRIREMIAARLEWLGLSLDMQKNRSGENNLTATNGEVAVLRLPTDEEAVIARDAVTLNFAH